MRVAMYYNNRDVRLEELPVPKIGPGELLVRPVVPAVKQRTEASYRLTKRQ